ncbi:unnamed protein product [Lasius platythorax]|uniref:HAT C-terminal dimerisation domain-containing protein n=1 Tax=Lasius platythorax TaxID=488582 RepID=A0AAV2NNQ7_9HYME
MNRFNKTSKILQTVDIDLQTAVELLQGLKTFVGSLRENVDDYEERGKILSKATDYKQSKRRSRKRKLQFDEKKTVDIDTETNLNVKTDMRVNTFNVILDQLEQELNHRLGAYREIEERFGFKNKLKNLSHEEVQHKAKHLQSIYNSDTEDDFPIECSHFKTFLPDDIPLNSIASTLQYIREKVIISTFPNIDVALKIFLSIAVTNCSAERSFSLLKRIKTALRNLLGEERLGALAVLNFNNDLVTSLSFENVIQDFAALKSRKHNF